MFGGFHYGRMPSNGGDADQFERVLRCNTMKDSGNSNYMELDYGGKSTSFGPLERDEGAHTITSFRCELCIIFWYFRSFNCLFNLLWSV